MSARNYDEKQDPVAYPPPMTAYPPPGQYHPQGPYIAPPPPMGYPTMDGPGKGHQRAGETTTRGDGFWKGCCAGLCCCCALDICF